MKLTGKNGTQVSDSDRDRKREDRKREDWEKKKREEKERTDKFLH